MNSRSLVSYFILLVLLCAGFIVGARMMGEQGASLAGGYMLTPAIAALITRIFFASTVAVSSTALMVAGGIAAALFGVSLWAVITKRTWSINLMTALALFDMIGEFVAQGTMGIMVTLSFIVATLLLIFTVTYRKQLNQTGILTEECLPDWERPRARKTFPPRSRVRVSDGRVPVDGEDVFENSVSIRRSRKIVPDVTLAG